MDAKLYVIISDYGMSMVRAISLGHAWIHAIKSEGTAHLKRVYLASKDDVAWYAAMGGGPH